MDKKDYKVTLNKESNTVSIEVKVDVRPKNAGTKYYDLRDVLQELKKLGHEASERSCIKRSAAVRSDDGERNASGVWEFALSKKETPKPAQDKPKPAQAKKRASTKKTSRKTTKSVVE